MNDSSNKYVTPSGPSLTVAVRLRSSHFGATRLGSTRFSETRTYDAGEEENARRRRGTQVPARTRVASLVAPRPSSSPSSPKSPSLRALATNTLIRPGASASAKHATRSVPTSGGGGGGGSARRVQNARTCDASLFLSRTNGSFASSTASTGMVTAPIIASSRGARRTVNTRRSSSLRRFAAANANDASNRICFSLAFFVVPDALTDDLDVSPTRSPVRSRVMYASRVSRWRAASTSTTHTRACDGGSNLGPRLGGFTRRPSASYAGAQTFGRLSLVRSATSMVVPSSRSNVSLLGSRAGPITSSERVTCLSTAFLFVSSTKERSVLLLFS